LNLKLLFLCKGESNKIEKETMNKLLVHCEFTLPIEQNSNDLPEHLIQ